jgi:hypothetical protein
MVEVFGAGEISNSKEISAYRMEIKMAEKARYHDIAQRLRDNLEEDRLRICGR